MAVLKLANFYIASIRETLRAVNVMTARDLAHIQKDLSYWNADHADCADCADWELFFLLVP